MWDPRFLSLPCKSQRPHLSGFLSVFIPGSECLSGKQHEPWHQPSLIIFFITIVRADGWAVGRRGGAVAGRSGAVSGALGTSWRVGRRCRRVFWRSWRVSRRGGRIFGAGWGVGGRGWRVSRGSRTVLGRSWRVGWRGGTVFG